MREIRNVLRPWLRNFRWFRRWHGGHWEQWWVETLHSEYWHLVDECSLTRTVYPFNPQRGLEEYVRNFTRYTGRPDPLCRGTPVCETWEAS